MIFGRGYCGLLIIAVVSLACMFCVRFLTFYCDDRWRTMPDVIIGFQNLLFIGVLVSAAIIAAMIPKRPFVGLLWIVAYTLALTEVRWYADRLAIPQRAAYANLFLGSLCYFVITQGLRVFLRWRITDAPAAVEPGAGQFRILDLLEWTASIGVWLVFLQLWEMPLENAPAMINVTTRALLICLPIALVGTSERGFTWRSVGWLLLWTFGVQLLRVIPSTIASGRGFQYDWWFSIYSSAFFCLPWLVSAGAIFAVLHRLGYRWRKPPRRVSPAASG